MKSSVFAFILTVLVVGTSLAQGRKRAKPLPLLDSLAVQPSHTPVQSFDIGQLVPSFAVQLAYNKTTSLIFPSAVRSVDLGSREILADKASEVENVLRVKSARIGFNETNFSVMTADGRFYSFVATYNEVPPALAVVIQAQPAPQFGGKEPGTPSSGSDRIEFEKLGVDQQLVAAQGERVLRARTRNLSSTYRQRMEGRATGLFVEGDLMYLRLRLRNRSNIPYDVGAVRFYASDRKKVREAALQELEVAPLTLQPTAFERINGTSAAERVFVFRKFTLSPRQRLRVMVEEKNGGRTLDWSLAPRKVLRARNLSSLSGTPRWFWKR